MTGTKTTEGHQTCSACGLCERTGDAPALTITRLPQLAAGAGTLGSEGPGK